MDYVINVMNYSIHQSLHGYSNKRGHHCISKSHNFSYESQQIILRMSDRSGFDSNGFDEYITYYELTNEKYFAFAKTWKAKEIKRPGCVWTHTLFLNEDFKNKLNNLKKFANYFIYPQHNFYNNYSKPISISDNDLTFIEKRVRYNNFETMFNKDFFLLVLAGLSEAKVKKIPLLLVANEPNQFEEFIFIIWSAFKDFTFCTWALSPRSINQVPLYFQIVQKNYRKEISSNILDFNKKNDHLFSIFKSKEKQVVTDYNFIKGLFSEVIVEPENTITLNSVEDNNINDAIGSDKQNKSNESELINDSNDYTHEQEYNKTKNITLKQDKSNELEVLNDSNNYTHVQEYNKTKNEIHKVRYRELDNDLNRKLRLSKDFINKKYIYNQKNSSEMQQQVDIKA